ncbi:hypothetical protein FQR65_LT03944 [Abscondita terminalis]|nr:hypothetical protein FQR65_LT03944 [Abscondita terminalis]
MKIEAMIIFLILVHHCILPLEAVNFEERTKNSSHETGPTSDAKTTDSTIVATTGPTSDPPMMYSFIKTLLIIFCSAALTAIVCYIWIICDNCC